MNWAEAHTLSLKMEHISGDANTRADWLSRTQLDLLEWRLHPALYLELVCRFGQPEVDLFARPENTQLPRFISCYPCKGALDYNAL